jgi:hypothetical protein
LGPFDLLSLFLTTQAFLVLGLHGVFKTLQGEAEHQKAEGLKPEKLHRVLLGHFRNILGQRDIVYAVVAISVLAGIAWAVNVAVVSDQIVQVWAFSLALIEALVLFFVIEILYLLSWKRLPVGSRRDRVFRRAVDILTLSGVLLFSISSATGCMFSIDLSCSAFGWLGEAVFATFFVVFFISGLGEMTIVDTLSETISSHIPLRPRRHFLYVGLLLLSMVALNILAGVRSIFGPGTGYLILGTELAIGFGIVYLAYLLVRGRELERFSTLAYGVLMFGLSGLFFAYTFRDIIPPALNFAGAIVVSPTTLILSLTVFVIGYLNLTIEIPKRAERKLGIRHDRLVASLTFLMIFTVVANYQQALFSGAGSAVFFFQTKVPASLGLWAGAVAFAIAKVRWAGQRGRVKTTEIVPHCVKCGQRLESTSKYCWNCGSNDLKTEKVLFAGDAKQIFDTPDHHSKERKLASLLLGGPFGFLAFGMDIKRRPGPWRQIIVTDSAAYFSGKTYPLDRILDVKSGHYSTSIVLSIEDNAAMTAEAGAIQSHPTQSIELKTSNPLGLSKAIVEAAPRIV